MTSLSSPSFDLDDFVIHVACFLLGTETVRSFLHNVIAANAKVSSSSSSSSSSNPPRLYWRSPLLLPLDPISLTLRLQTDSNDTTFQKDTTTVLNQTKPPPPKGDKTTVSQPPQQPTAGTRPYELVQVDAMFEWKATKGNPANHANANTVRLSLGALVRAPSLHHQTKKNNSDPGSWINPDNQELPPAFFGRSAPLTLALLEEHFATLLRIDVQRSTTRVLARFFATALGTLTATSWSQTAQSLVRQPQPDDTNDRSTLQQQSPQQKQQQPQQQQQQQQQQHSQSSLCLELHYDELHLSAPLPLVLSVPALGAPPPLARQEEEEQQQQLSPTTTFGSTMMMMMMMMTKIDTTLLDWLILQPPPPAQQQPSSSSPSHDKDDDAHAEILALWKQHCQQQQSVQSTRQVPEPKDSTATIAASAPTVVTVAPTREAGIVSRTSTSPPTASRSTKPPRPNVSLHTKGRVRVTTGQPKKKKSKLRYAETND